MTLKIESEIPPLRIDETGAIRIGKTRVLYVLVVRAFQNGATPEEIVRIYETLDLADTYSAIAYYLRNRNEVEQYLADYDHQAEEIRLKLEERQGSQVGVRDRLNRRLTERCATAASTHDHLNSSQTGSSPRP